MCDTVWQVLALAALGLVSSALGCRSDPVPRESAASGPVRIRADLRLPGRSWFEGPVVVEVLQESDEGARAWGSFAGSAGPDGLDATFDLPGWDAGKPTLVRIGPVVDWGETLDLERVTLDRTGLRLWVHEFAGAPGQDVPRELRVRELRFSGPPRFGRVRVEGAGPARRVLAWTDGVAVPAADDGRPPHAVEVELSSEGIHELLTWSGAKSLTVRELEWPEAPRDHRLSRGELLVLRAPLGTGDVELSYPIERFPEPQVACVFPLADHTPLDVGAAGERLALELLVRAQESVHKPSWIREDGRTLLRLNDLPPGEYVLELWPRTELAREGRSVEFRFTIPDSPGPHRFEVR